MPPILDLLEGGSNWMHIFLVYFEGFPLLSSVVYCWYYNVR